MSHINSLQNPLVKHVRSLELKKNRVKERQFVAEGRTVLERAALCGWQAEYLFMREGQRTPPISSAKEVVIVSDKVMEALSGRSNPPEALAVFRQPGGAAALPEGGLVILLDRLRDPGNLGTIVRTADALGASLILAGESCDLYAPDCVRATMGSLFAVAVCSLGREAAIDFARAWPGESVAARMEGREDYRRTWGSDTLLMMGSEATGLEAGLISAAQISVRIPMRAGPESLNVAIATAILGYAIAGPGLSDG